MEASEEKRNSYAEAIKDISAERLVYVDESGIDLAMCKDRGWSAKGSPILAKKSGKYYERTNIIAALTGNKSIAPMIFNGSCNSKLFETWVEKFLIRELKAGQVVIMDNASFHKSQKTRELIESAGCKLIFLPPYSPDLNPIEKFWANMKRYVRNKNTELNKLYDTLVSFFNAYNST